MCNVTPEEEEDNAVCQIRAVKAGGRIFTPATNRLNIYAADATQYIQYVPVCTDRQRGHHWQKTKNKSLKLKVTVDDSIYRSPCEMSSDLPDMAV